jgi:hypothetical protein
MENSMRANSVKMYAAAALVAAFPLAGCRRSSTENEPRTAAPAYQSSAGEHEHPSEGPHGGQLVELGNEQYHAEIVHDHSAGTVTVYLLDAAAEKPVPIDARELTINLKHGGRPEQFKLTASPDADDRPGRSSRFVSEDRELGEDLDSEGADPRLAVTIEGKPYTASIEHDHDHDDGDDHDHGHGDDHDDHEDDR